MITGRTEDNEIEKEKVTQGLLSRLMFGTTGVPVSKGRISF